MGYLDNSTIIVDAVLTDLGRKNLAEQGALDVSFYSFGDTGVDYTLYNVDHPSGSNSYGEAITRLPQLEPVPNNLVNMRYTLTTMPRNTYYVPNIVVDSSITLTGTKESDVKYLQISTNNMSAGSEDYRLTISNANFLVFNKIQPSMDLSTQVTHGVSGGHYLPDSSYQKVLVFNNVPGNPGFPLQQAAHKGTFKTTIKIEGNVSGDVKYVELISNGTLV